MPTKPVPPAPDPGRPIWETPAVHPVQDHWRACAVAWSHRARTAPNPRALNGDPISALLVPFTEEHALRAVLRGPRSAAHARAVQAPMTPQAFAALVDDRRTLARWLGQQWWGLPDDPNTAGHWLLPSWLHFDVEKTLVVLTAAWMGLNDRTPMVAGPLGQGPMERAVWPHVKTALETDGNWASHVWLLADQVQNVAVDRDEAAHLIGCVWDGMSDPPDRPVRAGAPYDLSPPRDWDDVVWTSLVWFTAALHDGTAPRSWPASLADRWARIGCPQWNDPPRRTLAGVFQAERDRAALRTVLAPPEGTTSRRASKKM